MAVNLSTPNLLPEPEHRPDLVPYQGGQQALAPVEPPAQGVQWGRYISALKRYKWLMLLIVVLGTAGGVVATRFIPPEYATRATIWIDAGSGGRTGPISSPDLLRSTQWVELLKTNAVLDPVVWKLSLFLTPEVAKDSSLFQTFTISDSSYLPGRYVLTTDRGGQRWLLERNGVEVDSGAVGDSVGRKVGFIWAPPAVAYRKNHKAEFKVTSAREASGRLLTSLQAGIPPQGSFMKLNLTGESQYRLAQTLNTLAQEFVSTAADLKKKKLTELRITLEQQLNTSAENLRKAESNYQQFRIGAITQPTEDVPIPGGLKSTDQMVTNDYFQQKLALDNLKQDRKALEQVVARARTGAYSVDAFQTIASVSRAPDLSKALQELSTYEADLRALRYRYTDEYKGIQDDLAKINSLKTQTIPQVAMALVDQLKSQEAQLEERIKTAETDLQKVPERTITEARLQRELTTADGLYRNLKDRYEEAKLSELSDLPDLRILDTASTPTKPSDNTALKIILMAVAASVGLAVGLALLLDQLDKRLRYPEQVTQELGLSILGAIPAIRKGKGGDLNPEEASQVVEAFRTIRLNLAHSYGAAGPVMLTISSPGAGDGKSLVSSNLAVSFAEAGYKTLLMDGDIRRGELHRMFAIDRRPGLLDYLTGKARMDEIIRQTTHRGLSVMPCGTRQHQGPELLGSQAMSGLMAEMKSRFNVIIVDSPPLGAGIDPFVLGAATGNLMLVLRSGETDRQMAEAKLRLVDRLPIRVLGAVLNDIQAQGVYRYYSYLYGYSAGEEPGARQLAGQAEGARTEG